MRLAKEAVGSEGQDEQDDGIGDQVAQRRGKNHCDENFDKPQQEASQRGIAGKDVTPYLLSLIAEMTQDRSLDTNIALVRANARLGAQIASELVGRR